MSEYATEIYMTCGILNFIGLMAFWFCRCVKIHDSKEDISNCLVYGFIGALFAGMFGWVATLAIVITLFLSTACRHLTNLALNLKKGG